MYITFTRTQHLIVLHCYNELDEEINISYCVIEKNKYYVSFNNWVPICNVIMNFLIASKLAIIRESIDFDYAISKDNIKFIPKIYTLELTQLALLKML